MPFPPLHLWPQRLALASAILLAAGASLPKAWNRTPDCNRQAPSRRAGAWTA